MDPNIKLIQQLLRDLNTLRVHAEREWMVAYRRQDEAQKDYLDGQKEAYTECIRLVNNVLVEMNRE